MKLPKRIVKLLFWGLIPLLILALAGQGNAQQYQYYDLGALGGPESQAYGINASGWVVGVAQTATGDWHAFLKTPTDENMQNLGTLGGGGSEAHGINASGSVVGKAQTATGDWHAFLKTIDDQNIQDLDVLWGTSLGTFNSANAINKDASVAGDLLLTPSRAIHAALKRSGEAMQDLGTLDGPYSYAQGINADGWVVGQAFTSSWAFHAFLKKPTDTEMEDLGTLGGNYSTAWAINDSGSAVGESEITPDGDWHAFLKDPVADKWRTWTTGTELIVVHLALTPAAAWWGNGHHLRGARLFKEAWCCHAGS